MSITASSSLTYTTTTTVTSGTKQSLLDSGCVPHEPELYRHSSLAKPAGRIPQVKDQQCREAMVETFRKDGFLVFENALDVDVVSGLDKALIGLTNGSNVPFVRDVHAIAKSSIEPDFTSGNKIPWVQYEAKYNNNDSNHSNATTTTETKTSATKSISSSIDTVEDVLRPENADRVRKLMGFIGYTKEIDRLVNDHQPLLTLVADLLGCPSVEDIELFQDMAMLKPPGGGREKPWHQDQAYFNVDPATTRVVGCWIAVDAATCDNGCMRIHRGGHKGGRPLPHFFKRDYQLCDSNAPSVRKGDDIVAVPLSPGGMVIFDGMVPHGTPTNNSKSDRRRALQFHWIQRGAKRMDANDPQRGRIQLFGGIPRGLSC